MVSGDAILGKSGIEEKEEINLIQIASASSKLFTLPPPAIALELVHLSLDQDMHLSRTGLPPGLLHHLAHDIVQ